MCQIVDEMRKEASLQIEEATKPFRGQLWAQAFLTKQKDKLTRSFPGELVSKMNYERKVDFLELFKEKKSFKKVFAGMLEAERKSISRS